MMKYVLKTDERMPSTLNFWGLEAAKSPEEAKEQFRTRVKNWYAPSAAMAHLRRMEDDRARRLREDDFEVEELS